MGKCIYCGEDCGWFRSYHKECKRKHENHLEDLRRQSYSARLQLEDLLYNCFIDKIDFASKEDEINDLMRDAYITNEEDKKLVYITVVDRAIEKFLEDGVIDEDEKAIVDKFALFTGVTFNELNKNKSIEKMLKSEVIGDILNGKTPKPRVSVPDDFPFMLKKNENFIWLFPDIKYYKQKTKREYVGKSHGVSIRIAKGVYYRIGASKGTPVDTTYMDLIDTGCVCLTDKNIYFSSSNSSFRIPYNKIISVNPHSNGVEINTERSTDKPIFLEDIDTWFVQNVISNLNE